VTIAGSNAAPAAGLAPVIGGGSLFAVDTAGEVHAFDAATGARRWTHAIEVCKDLRHSAFGGGGSYFDGKVTPPKVRATWFRSTRRQVSRCGGSSPRARCAVRRPSPSTPFT
jgi:hypothetical protein